MQLLEMTARLASKAKQLYLPDNFKVPTIIDSVSQSLHASLLYVARMFEYSGDSQLKELSITMLKHAEEIEKAGKVTPEIRSKVHNFLFDNNVSRYITEDIFLK